MNSGLTFIEIVVVLGIIGVLAAVATVRFTGTSTISVRASADMIQSDIRYTQIQAGSAKHQYTVEPAR